MWSILLFVLACVGTGGALFFASWFVIVATRSGRGVIPELGNVLFGFNRPKRCVYHDYYGGKCSAHADPKCGSGYCAMHCFRLDQNRCTPLQWQNKKT